jgi:DNA-binding CsgD family transcriptional regulator
VTLTSREIDVLHLIGDGRTTRQMSDRLGISQKTVENHKQRIFDKLGVQNQGHAIAIAMRRGLIDAHVGIR